jgi:DNA polymerase III subunit delta'
LTNWNSIVGQRRVKAILQRSFTTGRIPHAYLFYGPEGTGKDAAAFAFAALLNCDRPDGADPCGQCGSCVRTAALQHPNLKLIVPLPVGRGEKEGDDPLKALDEKTLAEYRAAIAEKAANPYGRIELLRANTIKINSIREIRKSLVLARAERGMKVVIISQAEVMNDSAANSLLKTLEEPAPNTVIILTTSRHDLLLPTILSRCQLVRFEALREEEIRGGLLQRDPSIGEQEAALVSRMADGSFSRALELTGTEDLAARRGEVIDLLRSIIARSPSVWMKDIESFAASNQRHAVARSLMLLNLWLRDAMMLQHENGGAVINLDQTEPLGKFVSHVGASELTPVINAVERAIALVGKNIYLSLVLINLAYDIRRNIVHR